jgi:hypothetical protein
MLLISSLELLNSAGFFVAKCCAEIHELYLYDASVTKILIVNDTDKIQWLSASEIIYNGQLLDVVEVTKHQKKIRIKYLKDNWEQLHLSIFKIMLNDDNSNHTNNVQQLFAKIIFAMPEVSLSANSKCFSNINKLLFSFNIPFSNCILLVEEHPPTC